jgi:lipoyl-dependent peroxiredoxin
MGGKEDATNPEQLFAAGYAACFGNAVLHVARLQKIALKDADVEIDAEVGIGPRAEGGFKLEVSLSAILTGVDQATAEKLVETAHQVCPYSNATRGNIDVALSVHTR